MCIQITEQCGQTSPGDVLCDDDPGIVVVVVVLMNCVYILLCSC